MKEEMNNELKMLVHEIIENATQALRRNDDNDEHWKVLLSLLRYKAIEYAEMYKRLEKEEEE
tara:strand:+ start:2029 stop:2214 length:186 start_codon:yes stop_codon:yes gene_type:complete